MQPKAHFLSRVAGEEKRRALRREVRLECQVFYLAKGLRGYSAQKAMMLDLSESGCLLACEMPSLISEHFYLVIKGLPAKFACAAVAKRENKVHTSFLQDLPTELVERLAKRSAPFPVRGTAAAAR